jgi:hypothetical protein
MVPIRVKFDGRYQSFQLVESYSGLEFEEGEEYCLVPDSPQTDIHGDADVLDSFDRNFIN